MLHVFDLGPHSEIFRTLCQDYPESTIYPGADFRVEWGPIFHRGRLDGPARPPLLEVLPRPEEIETSIKLDPLLTAGDAGWAAAIQGQPNLPDELRRELLKKL